MLPFELHTYIVEHYRPDQPKYRTLKISQLLEGPEKYLGPKTYARVNLDVDISYEEASFIKETFMHEYKLREMSLIPVKVEDMDMQISGEINFESVDSIVTSQLQHFILIVLIINPS